MSGARSAISNPPSPEADCHISQEEKRALVRRVVDSPTFASSPALRAFLLYIAEQALAGKNGKVKEHQIGTDVLGRPADYDPSTDNIVRVRAHELRQRLSKYFSTEGSHEPVIVSVPKGSYVPHFELSVSREPAGSRTKLAEARSRVSRGTLLILAGALACVLIFALIARAPSQGRSLDTRRQATALRDFWAPFFRSSDRPLLAIAADSGFALWQDLTERDLNLGDYLGRKYLQMDARNPKLRELAARRCTSPADLNITLRLEELSRQFGGRLNPQYARNVDVRELRKSNAVLIGSRRSNPWVELFECSMNFVLTRDAVSRAPVFQNRHPKPGEASFFGIPATLDVDGTEQKELESFAVIALAPNSSDGGAVVIVEGLNMEATEAAGEMATNAKQLSALLRSMGHRPGTPVRPFEVLLKLTSVPGGYANSRAVSFRYLGN